MKNVYSEPTMTLAWLGSLTVAWRTSDREVTDWLPAVPRPSNNPGQVVHTCLSVTKQYNLALA